MSERETGEMCKSSFQNNLRYTLKPGEYTKLFTFILHAFNKKLI